MFAWRYLGGDNEEVGNSERFSDQESAEAWLGESWPGLREQGVDHVELLDEERGARLYRMSLLDE